LFWQQRHSLVFLLFPFAGRKWLAAVLASEMIAVDAHQIGCGVLKPVWAAPQSVQECCSGSFAWPELPPLRPRVPMPLARAIFRSHFQPQLVQIFLAGRLLLFRGWLLCCDFPEPGSLGQIIGH